MYSLGKSLKDLPEGYFLKLTAESLQGVLGIFQGYFRDFPVVLGIFLREMRWRIGCGKSDMYAYVR